jgi:hypothetical protein
MVVSSDFRYYVSSHSFSESFLYNNRLFFSKLIAADEYNANRDFILAKQKEQGIYPCSLTLNT